MATSALTKVTIEETKKTTKVKMQQEAVYRISEVEYGMEWNKVEWSRIEWSGVEQNAGKSETAATTAVSISTDQATLSLTVIPEIS